MRESGKKISAATLDSTKARDKDGGKRGTSGDRIRELQAYLSKLSSDNNEDHANLTINHALAVQKEKSNNLKGE